MTATTTLRALCRGLLPAAVVCACACAGPARGATLAMPDWQQLVFEQRSFWARARGEVTLKRGVAPLFPDTQADPFLRIEVQNTVGASIESIVVDVAGDDVACLARWRLSRGRDQRLKTHRYLDEAVLRERREPAAASGDREALRGADSRWVSSGVTRVPLPPAAASRRLLSPHALFLLLPGLLDRPQLADDYLLHTDLNFFRLEVDAIREERVRSAFRLDGDEINGERRVRALTLRVLPLPGNPEAPDFELMGLSGAITVLVDEATGLPLKLRGEAPRIGSAELNLVEAQTRPALARATAVRLP